MNLLAALMLTLALVVLPADPAYGARAPQGHASPTAPAPAIRTWPVSDIGAPAAVARGFKAPRSRWGPGHRGVDLRAETGAQVRAPGPGIVTFAGAVAGRDVVVVSHPGGLRSSLEPVTAALRPGTSVAAGDVVGVVEHASPGHCAPRSCVHWGVRQGDRYLDPLSLLGPARPAVVLLPDG